MIGISVTEITTKIIGIPLIVIGLSVFSISYNQGSIGQDRYSGFMCAVDATPKACTIADNQMTGGFIGMMFVFFTTLFGASLVVPSVLMKMIRRMKGS